MKAISYPLKLKSQGPTVADLHNALQLLIDKKAIRLEDNRQKLQTQLRAERTLQSYGAATKELVAIFQKSRGLKRSGKVDEKTTAALNEVLREFVELDEQPSYVVKGSVRFADGLPAAGYLVIAVDRDLRTEQELGSYTTDRQGLYQIRYSPQEFRRAEKGQADLQVRVKRNQGTETLHQSDILFNAPEEAVIDIQLNYGERKLSEYELLLKEIEPLLEGGVDLASLEPEDVSFISGDTGIAVERISWLAKGATLEKQFKLPAEVFYGWFRQGIPTEVHALWLQPVEALIKALRTAIGGNVVPHLSEEEFIEIKKKIDNLLLKESLGSAPKGARATLGNLLETMPKRLKAQEQRIVAKVIREAKQDLKEITNKLSESGLTDLKQVMVERTLRLDAFTMKNLALVKRLQEITKKDKDASLSSLAGVPTDQWLDLTYSADVPSDTSLSEEAYASHLIAAVEDMHPTATLAARLKEGVFPFVRPGLMEVGLFLKENPDFDIVKANLETFVEKANFNQVADREGVIESLRSLQRIKKLSATWEETGILLYAGINSSLDVVKLGRHRLRELFSDIESLHRADIIYNNAKDVHDTTIGLIANFLPNLSPLETTVIPRPAAGADVSVLEEYPTLQSLFGSLDGCKIQHCRSVLSPAAYFVDLLELLKDSMALPVFLSRRPDLAELELSCENTEIEHPHIDLVLEILENAASLPLKVKMPPEVKGLDALKKSPLHESIKEILQKTVIDLSEKVEAEKELKQLLLDRVTRWTVTDRHRRWSLLHTEGGFYGKEKGSMRTHKLDLKDINTEQFISDLDNGKVHSNAKSLFETFLKSLFGVGPDSKGLNYQVSMVKEKERWEIRVRLLVEVDMLDKGDFTEITVKSGDGGQLLKNKYSKKAGVAIKLDLKRNLPNKLLNAILSRPGRITAQENDGKWTLFSPLREIELWYVPEVITVGALGYQSNPNPLDNPKISPQNRNPHAYEKIRKAKYPWSLPFDLPLEELRIFLDRTGTSRLRLMELLYPSSRLVEDKIAREFIGLSDAEGKYITEKAEGSALWELWGLKPDNNGDVSIYDASDGVEVQGKPLHVLAHVSVLLQLARLEFPELLDLLQTRYINKDENNNIQVYPLDECRPSKMGLANLTEDHLDRIHRFVRLRGRLGWKTHELDLAILAFKDPEISSEVLLKLSHIKRLQSLLSLPLEVITSWWGGFGTPVYLDYSRHRESEIKPLYDRLFLNPLFKKEKEPDFELNEERKEFVKTNGEKTLTEKNQFLSSVLNESQMDIEKLIAAPELLTDELTLDNLSKLHRAISLAKAMGLTIVKFLGILRLTHLKPFESTEAAINFCEVVGFIQNSPFSPEELLYLLRHEEHPELQIALRDERIRQHVKNIQMAIQAKRRETDIEYEETNADIDEVKGRKEELRLLLSDVAVLQVSTELGIDQETTSELLRSWLRHPEDPSKPAEKVFLEKSFVEGESQKDKFPKVFALLQKLHKIGIILSRLGITPTELAWMANKPSKTKGMEVLELNELPVEKNNADSDKLFEAWRCLVVLISIRDRASGSGRMITNYVGALRKPDRETARKVLADGLTISEEIVKDAAIQIGIVDLDHYHNPIKLLQLFNLLITIKNLGVITVDQVTEMAESVPSAEAAANARNLLRARYGPEHWNDLLSSISNDLRGRQRDALVDYLVARDSLSGAEDLYERHLIDVQMAPCMLTTRLVQGIAAIQLFIQRCLLNLEPDVSPSSIDRDLWEWMKNYRVWEANRKVFLYPENWLLPELRDDQTQIFRELISALDQSEPSHDSAKEALLTYLDQFNELTQISVISMYEDTLLPQGSGERVLYVVGRSYNPPYNYFWRKCEAFGTERMQWSGWERADLDISGDHAIPFVFGRDFHIAWPIIQKISKNEKEEQWEVRLAWARRGSKGWNQKKTSRAVLKVDALPGKDEHNSFAFRAVMNRVPIGALKGIDDGGISAETEELSIHCYAGKEKIDPTAILPQREDNLRIDEDSSILSLNVDGIAYLKFNEESTYDYASGAEVWLFIEPKDGDEYDSWTAHAAGYLGAPLQLNNTGSNGRFWYSFYADDSDMMRFLKSVKYVIKVKYPNGEAEEDEQEIELLPGKSSCTWFPEFILKANHTDKRSKPTKDPERPVDMVWAGALVLTSVGDAVLAQGAGPEIDEVEGSTAFSTGYREDLKRNESDSLKLGAASELPALELFKRTPGQFYITRATAERNSNPDCGLNGSTWYYRDTAGQFYLSISENVTKPQWLVLNDGNSHANIFRTLANSDPKELYQHLSVQKRNDEGQKFLSRSVVQLPNKESIFEESVSFDLRAPYTLYNFEIFLHAPLLTARHLFRQQRFEEAQRWLHYVFDPTTNDPTPGAARFWRFLPFRKAAQGANVRQLIEWLANPQDMNPEKAAFLNQLAVWKKNPFRPHAVARLRLNAYQWSVLFTYLDNLIAWGDQLFRRDTRESINEATQLYVLATKILGPRPRTNTARFQQPPLTYGALAGRWDEFSNVWFAFADHPLMQAWLSFMKWLKEHGIVGPQMQETQTQLFTSIGVTYFGVPQNEKLLEYWNVVEDRLFKIRHCQNFDGISRDLPLFEPPIDPELLIRATAAGVDIAAVLADRAAPLPHYRFNVMLQKAAEVCAELKSLGAALLAAMEKQDAEQLTMLRSGQEIELLRLVSQLRQQQIDEAKANLEALRQSEVTIMERFDQYQKLLGSAGAVRGQNGLPVLQHSSSLRVATDATGSEVGLGLIRNEIEQLEWLDWALGYTWAAGISNALAGLLHLIPDREFPDPATVVSKMKFGGSHLGAAASALGSLSNTLASNASHYANRASLFAGYERRRDELVFQSKITSTELEQLRKQIIAAEIRVSMAEREMENHERQIEQADDINAFMRDKYSNRELYSWMSGQISSVYFRTYQLAYDTAKRAERAFRFELGLAESNFIQFGYWDSLKKGLLAGERLYHDLKRMELAFLEQNKREYELTKHVSLRQLDPLAMLSLKFTGLCEIELPEWLFDLDCPGHYCRRLKTVNLSIPSVTGPYSSVSCTLTLSESEVRTSPLLKDSYARQDDNQGDNIDSRFIDFPGTSQSIVTSSGQNDSGMFETNLRDERYLPFEGAGVISTWKLELPTDFPQFDYQTISDVILHVRYTALQGGEQLRTAAIEYTKTLFEKFEQAELAHLFSLKHEFPSEWQRFLHPENAADKHLTEFGLTKDRFPYQFQAGNLSVENVELYFKFNDDIRVNGKTLTESFGNKTLKVNLKQPTEEDFREVQITMGNNGGIKGLLPNGSLKVREAVTSSSKWAFKIESDSIMGLGKDFYKEVEYQGKNFYYFRPDVVKDIVIVCQYSVKL